MPDQLRCNGTCVRATNCSSCSGAPLYCRFKNECVSACTTCWTPTTGQLPIECFACRAGARSTMPALGSCEAYSFAGYCLSGDYTQAYPGGTGMYCDCSGTQVSRCPGSQHVCRKASGTDYCITCGEAGMNTHGLPCKGGGTCDTASSPPRCR
ncbi:MAG: hypothetical protein IT371_08110 [Deltaproteobacteria bacterium]|nr:hypothetical protein [Deltaproteobacteria bacterium]